MWSQGALSRDRKWGWELQFMEAQEMDFQYRRVCKKNGKVRGGWADQ